MKGSSANLRHFVVAAAALIMAGCATAPEPPPVEPEPEPIVVVEPDPEPIPIEPPVEPDPEPLELPGPPAVAIVLTSRQPAYEAVALELGKRLENYTIYDISDKSQPPITAFRLINDSESGAVIAIGLRAAKSSIAMSETPVVFTQVFNYQDHGLITENSRGVSAIAPLKAHLDAWQEIDPNISRIGAIIGKGHEDLVAEAKLAAEERGMQLIIHEVSSDQEALYHFRRTIRNIDAFWLFPDNRVLSARSLNEILTQARQRQVPVSVPNESLLSLGAAISVSTVASDIASTIVDIIRMIEAGRIADVPSVSPLSETRVVVNKQVAMN